MTDLGTYSSLLSMVNKDISANGALDGIRVLDHLKVIQLSCSHTRIRFTNL